MLILLTTVHTIICLFLILVVLLQQGKGADLSVFGGGSTQAVFGARGAATLLHKLTVAGFVGFIITTIGIGFLGAGKSRASVMSTVGQEAPAPVEVPAAAETGEPTAPEATGAGEADASPADASPADSEPNAVDTPPATEDPGSDG
jgi:preprotein translocase subunit SecG